MKVNLEKTFPMPAPPAAAWGFLQNIESVAACMPGAKITEQIDDTHYKGEVTARVGPANLSFTGTIEVLEVDPATMTLRMLGKGTDRSGSSGASMDLTARIEPADDGKSNLIGNSTVTMSGKAATFGGRMMVPVADQILKQFAAIFAERLQESESELASASGGAARRPDEEGSAAREPSLNAIALMWAVIKDSLGRLFGKKGS
jgi:carbon monoxide dehydrogenase subunit G